MIRPELTRIAAKVRARLQSGAALTWRDVWAMAPDASHTWAHETLLGYTRRGTGWVKHQNRNS